MANGILGLLCKRHYLGAMYIAGVRQLASSWEHYIAVPDSPDERTMGKSSWHYIYEYIIFIAPSFEIMTLFTFFAGFLQMRGGNDAQCDAGG